MTHCRTGWIHGMLVVFLLAARMAQLSAAESTYFPPPESLGGWRKLDKPEEIRSVAGMDPTGVAALREWLLQSDDRNFAAVVIRRGYIVLEVERGNSAITDVRRVASVSKAVCATVLAIASERSQQGLTPRKMSFNDPAFQFIPWAQPLSDPRKTNITVKQLLNHTSGICPEANGAPNDGSWEYILGHSGDPRTVQLAFDPGTACGYSTHALAHAALVCETVTGKPYDEFAVEALFKPLGIEHWSFQYYDGGEKYGRHPSHGLGMPARDLARVAYCMLQGGRWGNQPVIPKWFVEETAASTHDVTTPEMRWKFNPQVFSHGWELPARMNSEGGRSGEGIPKDARSKPGSGGQFIAFVPSLDLVVIRQTGSSGEWQFEEYLRRACQAVAPKPAGHVFYETDFEEATALNRWQGRAEFGDGYKSGHALLVERHSNDTSNASAVWLPLPVDQMRGCIIRGTAMVKAVNVTARPNPWNGIKFMLALEAPSGRLWPQADIETGSFDWKRVAFSTRIPADATAVTLHLGLEQVSGKVWFDDVKITLAKPPTVGPQKALAGPPYKGHEIPRLRGAMISPSIDAESLRVLGRQWKANLIRWQLIRQGRPGQPSSLDGFDSWLEGELRKLESALPGCEKNGLSVVVDLHSPPGGKATVSGYVGSDDRLFTDPKCQAKFVDLWQRIALRFKSSKVIWGYDLANEPVEDLVEDGCDDWQGLAERAARAIRAIDPDRAIIVEAAPWGGPEGLNELVPLNVSNVVYSFHMYIPHAFTHQGVHQSGPEYRYPGMINGKLWDKAQLEAAMQPAIRFQNNRGVHLYVGEFSAIRWAPDNSAYRYLKDLIEIFEAHGWDWSYHAFREWDGWSVEHGPDRQDRAPTATPGDRQRLLEDWFSRNQKPSWANSN